MNSPPTFAVSFHHQYTIISKVFDPLHQDIGRLNNLSWDQFLILFS